MSENKEKDLLKKPNKVVSNNSEKPDIKKVLVSLTDEQFESIINSLDCLDSTTRNNLENILTDIRNNHEISDDKIDFVAKLDIKSTRKAPRSCTLL